MVDEINPGLGTLNRLFIAAELMNFQINQSSTARIGLIEEVEAHIHPQAQMKIIETLQNESKSQFFLTSHSPNLASKVKLEKIFICNKSGVFSLSKEQTKLSPDDYQSLEWFLDVTKANLFFARSVIMVEGWSEEILIPAIADYLKRGKILKKNITESGASIVNVGSAEFRKYSNIFLRKDEIPTIGIPVSVITDLDVPEYSRKLRSDASSLPEGQDEDEDEEVIESKKYDYQLIEESEITEKKAKKNRQSTRHTLSKLAKHLLRQVGPWNILCSSQNILANYTWKR